MGRIFNKMYIVSGGVKPEDKLSIYRFQTKKMLDTTLPWGYVTPLFDIAIEIDTTGHHVEYDKFSCDNYWTTWDNTQLKDLKYNVVAKVNEKWEYIVSNSLSEDDAKEYLRKNGYTRPLDMPGSGWYRGQKPPFKLAIFSAIHRWLKLEWDFKRNRYAGIVPNMKKDELTIYTGKSSHFYDDEIGHINVDGNKVIVTLDGRTYTFSKETDQDFIDFITLCEDAENKATYEETAEEMNNNPEIMKSYKPGFFLTLKQNHIQRNIERFAKIFEEYK